MNIEISLILMLVFLCKHFVADFLLQTPYQYVNKGIYLHPGGLLHSFIHTVGTFITLIIFSLIYNVILENYWLIVFLSLMDGILHYHIDFTKVNICKKFDLTPINSDKWYALLGFDQLLHNVCYVIIVMLFLHT